LQKTAIVTGIRGQGGAYLSRHLLNHGYHVIGCDRRRADVDNWRLEYLGINEQIEFVYMDLLDEGSIQRVIRKYKPDEFYNMAAQSFVGVSFEQPYLTTQVNAVAVLKILESLRTFNPDCKFYQASTSEMFGKVLETPQTEETPFNPRSPYGVAKTYAHFMTKNYRESYDMFASSGILFNHESPVRGLEFVSRKITHTVANIYKKKAKQIVLGNINTKRDWGFAEDFTFGIFQILQQEKADDFVLATGKTTTVREFAEMAFRKIDIEIEWSGEGVDEKGMNRKTGDILVSISPAFFRPAEVDVLIGDYSKAKNTFGWEPKTDLNGLVELMMDFDLR